MNGIAQAEREAFCMVTTDAVSTRFHQIILLVSFIYELEKSNYF